MFNPDVWKPVLAAAGVIPMRKEGDRWKASRKDGFHVLRHTDSRAAARSRTTGSALGAQALGPMVPAMPLHVYLNDRVLGELALLVGDIVSARGMEMYAGMQSAIGLALGTHFGVKDVR